MLYLKEYEYDFFFFNFFIKKNLRVFAYGRALVREERGS